MRLTRRELLAATGASAAAVGFTFRRRRRPWNILLISSDEHNARAMSCAGHPVVNTPNLDALAAQGVRMNAAYAAAPVCAPARQSLITGLWPPEHGQITNGHVFDAGNATLPGLWTANGLRTAAYGKLHTNSEGAFGFGDARAGQDEWYVKRLRRELKGANPPGVIDPADQAVFDRIEDQRFWGMPLDDDHLLPDRAVLDMSLAFLAAQDDRPFFLYASFIQPHHFWTLPRAHYYAHAPADVDLPRTHSTPDPAATRMAARHHWPRDMDEEATRLARARYYGGISYMDSLVGELLDGLEALGLARNTVVAYVSDHGDMLGEKGLWFKGVLYEDAVRIPVILRQPGVLPKGAVSDMPMSQIDLLPTLGGLANQPLEGTMSGRDLSQQILGKQPPVDHCFSVQGAFPGAQPQSVLLRQDQYKLIEHATPKGQDPRWELYDLAQDPWEEREISADQPDRVAAMSTRLNAWVDQWKAPAFPPRKSTATHKLE